MTSRARVSTRQIGVESVAHAWQPVLPASEVRRGPGFPVLEGLDCASRCHYDAETCWAANTLLRGSEDNVKFPVVECDLFRADTANAIHDDQGLRADSVNQFTQRLDLAQHSGRRVHVCHGDELIFLLLERLLYFVELGSVANRCLQLRCLRAVCLEAVCKGVCET